MGGACLSGFVRGFSAHPTLCSWILQDCEDTREIYGLMDEFSKAATPGRYMAETLPGLAKLPAWMQWWRKEALRSFNRQAAIWMKYWTGLRTKMEQGQAPECFVKQFIETDYEKNKISELQASFVAGSMS